MKTDEEGYQNAVPAEGGRADFRYFRSKLSAISAQRSARIVWLIAER
jgi:hypothetical protein